MTLGSTSRRILDEHLQSLSSGSVAVRPPVELTKSVKRLHAKYGGGPPGAFGQDRLERAVLRLIAGHVPERGDQMVMSHKFTEPVQALEGKSLLDSRFCDYLLSLWEGLAAVNALHALIWRGLFRSFMQARPCEATERMRHLLGRSLDKLEFGKREPMWLAAARRHEDLLGDTPCFVYIQELVAGESEELDDLREEFPVPPASWFWKELTAAALAYIKTLGDSIFKARIPHILSLPERLPNCEIDILATTLTRYSECQDRSLDARLLQLALDKWGSPQLKIAPKWDHVRRDVKQMVCGWLAQEDLEDFYYVCQRDRQVDQRRLRYWLRYKEQMGFTQILLGGGLRYSNNADVKDFIKKKKGRLGALTECSAANNAIIMQIGGLIFVEFSETGNACYGYRVDQGIVDTGLKSYTHRELRASDEWRLLHIDGNETWEEKFESALRSRGVFPDSGVRAR